MPSDAGTVAAGATFDNSHDDASDIVRLSVSGAHPTTFEVAQTRTESGHCLLWGEVLSA